MERREDICRAPAGALQISEGKGKKGGREGRREGEKVEGSIGMFGCGQFPQGIVVSPPSRIIVPLSESSLGLYQLSLHRRRDSVFLIPSHEETQKSCEKGMEKAMRC